MGGYGSGNRDRRWRAHDVTGERFRLDVAAFKRGGMRIDDIGGRHPWLTMTAGAIVYEWRPVEPGAALEGGPVRPAGACLVRRLDVAHAPTLRLPIEWRRVGYGWRPFWRCRSCGELARIVYGPAPSVAAAMPAARLAWCCRRCARVAYVSTRRTAKERAETRVLKAAAALGVTYAGGSLWDIPTHPPRPSGMHWRTYLRRLEALDAAQRAHIAETVRRLAQLEESTLRMFRPIIERAERRRAREARAVASGAASG